MSYPQPGLFVQGVSAHRHIEYTLRPGVSMAEVRAAVAGARAASAWLNGPNITWGFAPQLWARLNPADVPTNAQSFQPVLGANAAAGKSAPATQWDIWVWCSSNSHEDVDCTSDKIRAALGAVAEVELSLPAYTTPQSVDPTGFIDGTENPKLDEAQQVTLYPDGEPGAGGTSALIQKWVHKLPKFAALPVAAQEDVFGRTKDDSTQLAAGAMPDTSHVSRNTVVGEDGAERHIYRRNTPFKTEDETGTQFIGLTNDTDLMMEMLRRMFGVAGDGLHDKLVDFSDATTGSWYFVPAMAALTATFGGIESAGDTSADEPDETSADTSLGIGSLIDEANLADRFSEE